MTSAGSSSTPSRRPAARELTRLGRVRVKPADQVPAAWAAARPRRAADARRERTRAAAAPEVSYEALLEIAGAPCLGRTARADERLPAQVRTQVEVRARYAGYIERQQDEIERARRNEEPRACPPDLDYMPLTACRTRCARQLSRRRARRRSGRPAACRA